MISVDESRYTNSLMECLASNTALTSDIVGTAFINEQEKYNINMYSKHHYLFTLNIRIVLVILFSFASSLTISAEEKEKEYYFKFAEFGNIKAVKNELNINIEEIANSIGLTGLGGEIILSTKYSNAYKGMIYSISFENLSSNSQFIKKIEPSIAIHVGNLISTSSTSYSVHGISGGGPEEYSRVVEEYLKSYSCVIGINPNFKNLKTAYITIDLEVSQQSNEDTVTINLKIPLNKNFIKYFSISQWEKDESVTINKVAKI